jgi:hypothetical protein
MERVLRGKSVRFAIGSSIPIEAAIKKLERTIVGVDDVTFFIATRITIVYMDLHNCSYS